MLRTEVLQALLLVGGWFGHVAVWIAANNRAHAAGLSRKAVKLTSAVIYAIVLAGTALLALALVGGLLPVVKRSSWIYGLQAHFPNWLNNSLPYLYGALLFYAVLCLAFALLHYPKWAWWRWHLRAPLALRSTSETIIDASTRLGHWPIAGVRSKICSLIPGNQLVSFSVNEKRLAVERLPKELAGLSIVHLSDLHFSGRITREYFDEVVERTNALDADIIAVTGDICEKPRYIDWIPATLGKLQCRHGKFFVLGNHDLRVDVGMLRGAMAYSGFVDVAAKRQEAIINTQRLLLCGNERPWFSSASTGEKETQYALRILLAHTPDQLPWARAHNFDLMLAGHTHGGQIRMPLVGATVCPSRFGVKYAGGTFYEAPTLMHVTRGISSLTTVRLNCMPEVTKLVLVSV